MPSAAIEPWPIAVVSKCDELRRRREYSLLSGNQIVAICRYCALAVVECFQSGKVHRLADRGNDQISRNLLLVCLR